MSQPEKVLVIDDDSDLALMTTLWVRSAGYQAVMARDGASGLAAAETYRPDIILLDIMMPGLDGFEVSRRLKEIPHLAPIPVIFLSAKVQEIARREALAAGGKYFLSKPYEGKDLMVAIQSALQSSTFGV
jgi:two-component system, OmpR family, phosphate regulon response regulator PhoB